MNKHCSYLWKYWGCSESHRNLQNIYWSFLYHFLFSDYGFNNFVCYMKNIWSYLHLHFTVPLSTWFSWQWVVRDQGKTSWERNSGIIFYNNSYVLMGTLFFTSWRQDRRKIFQNVGGKNRHQFLRFVDTYSGES